MNVTDIRDIERRFLVLEEVLAGAVAGEFRSIEVQDEDPLAAIELGVNIVLEDLRAQIEQTMRANRELDDKVIERTRELQEKLDHITAQNRLITRQREAIRVLSTPVLQLWDRVIAMPIIGVVDTRRATEIAGQLLGAIQAREARFAILDITGVELVDTGTAEDLTKVIRAAQLLGTRCVITGIRPAVALTMAELGVDLSQVQVCSNLENGLRACIEAMVERGDAGP
jgi:rsbT co-antagonist protein RsbR